MKIDKKIIKELSDYLKEFNLTEIEITEKDTRIKVSKNNVSISNQPQIVSTQSSGASSASVPAQNIKSGTEIINNEVEEADILAFYSNSKNIKFTIRTNDKGDKITTLFSSRAKPLVDRYKFIRGFKDDRDGYLDFYSIKKDGVSTSKLVIDNFKVKEIPALAKLLALASLQGIADLLTGEGIRFTDFEMDFTYQDKIMKIQELYAIGPAISFLLEGYIVEDKLISLRGTLVPATTINRSIASIPLLGDLLIGKKVGDGVFGVSFKIKGPPKNLETTVNPIKTLTPRFITRTLEKIKKN